MAMFVGLMLDLNAVAAKQSVACVMG